MYQAVLMLEDKRNVLLACGLGMADVPGQPELRTFQQEFDRFLLVFPEAVGILHRDPDIGIADPLFAFIAEYGK